MATSSSTKRAAKMAQRGKGRKVRFQNGTTFPAIIALILVLGTGLIAYSRLSIAPDDKTPPQPGVDWEFAYGFNICGTWYEFAESAAVEDTPAFDLFEKYGLTSEGDGIGYLTVTEENAPNIAGKRAVLQKFFDVYGANVGDDEITFSPDYLPREVGGEARADEKYTLADNKCGDADAELAMRVWNSPTAADSERYIAKFGQKRITQPGMVIAIYFDDPDAEQTQPPSVEALQAQIAAAAATPTVSTPDDSATVVDPDTSADSATTVDSETASQDSDDSNDSNDSTADESDDSSTTSATSDSETSDADSSGSASSSG